jgi:hypothetical protein
MALMKYPEGHQEEDDEFITPESGPTYRLIIDRGSRRGVMLNLTGMTEPELDVSWEIIKMAFDLARPIVLERDKKAAEAYANGDDSFSRSYRPVPQFVVRERSFGPDDQSVLQRLKDSAARHWLQDNSDARVRATSRPVADEVSPGTDSNGSKDNGEAIDESKSVREVGEVGADAERLQPPDSSEGSSAPSA